MVRIYDRPDLDQRRGLPALYVTGALPNGKPGLAYEGRLQIHNAIGACTVEQIDGDMLPSGHALYVDQQAGEVVIAWPEYVEAAAPITNPQFEDGMAGWAAGAGWSVTTDNPITGSRSAVYARNPGSSILSSQSRYPVSHGTPIKAGCRVRQGASSAGNAGAGVRLEFRDDTGAVIGFRDGNMVMQGSNNQVRSSDVTAAPPANASTVNIACHGLRKRQNRELWADDFSWDHKVAHAGINIETTLNITLRVRDSAGRTALWSGQVEIMSRPSEYRVFTNPNTPILSSEKYRHESGEIVNTGHYNNTDTSNVFGFAADDAGRIAAVCFNAVPRIKVLPVSESGAFGPAFADPIPALPSSARCAAFTRSSRAIVVGLGGSPYIAAYRIADDGGSFGAAYDPPTITPSGRVNSVVFSRDGSIAYVATAGPPFLLAYRWSDATGFGERLTLPDSVAGAISDLSITESGGHIAALHGGTPSAYVYSIGPDGFISRAAAFGSNGQGGISISDEAGAIAYGSALNNPRLYIYRWSPVGGVGALYPAPTPPDGSSSGRGPAFSRDGLVLFVGTTGNSGLSAYEWAPGVGTTSGPVSRGANGVSGVVSID